MKFLIVLAIAIAVAAAKPHEYQKGVQAKGYQQQGYSATQERSNSEHEKFDLESDLEQGYRSGSSNMGMDDLDMDFDQSIKEKRSYGGAKCGKAVVVACSPIVKKVKCKGGY